MKVDWKQVGSKLIFDFTPEPGDLVEQQYTKTGNPFKLASNSCFFELPSDWSVKSCHPDMLAAATAFLIDPFTNGEIKLPISITKNFANEYMRLRRKKIGPVDAKLKPRKIPANSIQGLSFSGGVDSTAAAVLMPKDSALIFTNRDMSGGKKAGLYDKSAALFACKRMNELGHNVISVLTDFEYLREPAGFPTHLSSSVPSMLLADYLKLDSIAYGMILESAFGIGDNKFARPQGAWRKLLIAAGLPVSLVTGGMSEVGTTKVLLRNKDYRGIGQSCVRGKPQQPCGKCVKCFRKILLELAMTDNSLDSFQVNELLVRPEVYKHITKSPLHHEDVYAYIFQNYDGNNVLLRQLKRKVRAGKIKTDWLDKWFADTEEYLAPKHRKSLTKSIISNVEPMTKKDIKELMNWDPKSFKKGLTGVGYRFNSMVFRTLLWIQYVQSEHWRKIQRNRLKKLKKKMRI